MYSDDFMLKSSIVELILSKRRATPLNMPFLEDFFYNKMILPDISDCQQVYYIQLFLNDYFEYNFLDLENKYYYLKFPS